VSLTPTALVLFFPRQTKREKNQARNVLLPPTQMVVVSANDYASALLLIASVK
jgi:hypothetical protein